ncbi:MAG TPA: VOC family protein [Caulobacteraceae bacterium]|jgi:catechol 2,3-dioxygenase-like lactoylglutathione lyase family enzyme
MPPPTLHHLDLTVSDLARARAFYLPIMGFLGYRLVEDTERDLGFAPDDDSATAIFFHPARGPGRDQAHDRYAPGLHHLAFRAASRDEVDSLHRLLQRLGTTVLDPPAVYYPPDYYAVFFADPDGIKLELAFNPGGH